MTLRRWPLQVTACRGDAHDRARPYNAQPAITSHLGTDDGQAFRLGQRA